MSEWVKVYKWPGTANDIANRDNPADARVEVEYQGQTYTLNQNEIKAVPFPVAAILNTADSAVTIFSRA